MRGVCNSNFCPERVGREKAEVDFFLLRCSRSANRARRPSEVTRRLPSTLSCLARDFNGIEFKLGTGTPDTPHLPLIALGVSLWLLHPTACVTLRLNPRVHPVFS